MEVTMSASSRRIFDRAFKLEAVKLVTEQGYKATEAAARLGVCSSVISKWKRELLQEGSIEAAFPGKGYVKPAEAEVKQLKNQLEKVTRERDILKKAIAYFTDPLK